MGQITDFPDFQQDASLDVLIHEIDPVKPFGWECLEGALQRNEIRRLLRERKIRRIPGQGMFVLDHALIRHGVRGVFNENEN